MGYTEGMNNTEIFIFILNIILSGIVASLTMTFRIGQYKEKVDQLEKCDFQRRLSTLEGQYSVGNITQRNSPISLNERGTKILTESGADQFVKNNLNELVEKIKLLGSSTAYDIQENSKIVIESYKDDVRFVPLKKFAFDQGIDLVIIQTAAAINLRDMSLSMFDFTSEDIDKTTPIKE